MATEIKSTIPLMEIAEFRRLGLLQEVNRLFFHPLGLALEVSIEADGTERMGGIWDYRDDPEGMAFVDGEISLRKAHAVAAMKAEKIPARAQLFGVIGGVQPLPDHEEEKLDGDQ